MSQAIYADEAKYLKKRTKGGALDVHPTEKALIVNYEVEATILGEFGDPIVGERKESQKIIKLKNLTSETDVAALAREVVKKCSLIHQSKIPEVEQLLYYLQNRKENANLNSQVANAKKKLNNKLEDPNIDDINETANINDLDDYAEMLYDEDIETKIRGSALILQLARNPDNLEELASNESVLNCLARVLKEEWQRSIEVSTNIIYAFFCFSSFSQFHTLVAHHKIGNLTVQIIEFELKRCETWQNELNRRKKMVESKGKSPMRPKSGRQKQETSQQDERVIIDLQRLIQKQEQLLRVAFYMLLNLAEDIKVEMKMVNKKIVSLLIQTLDRDNSELLILVVSFLKKLSIFIENKNQMREEKAVVKLAKLVPCDQEDLLNITLRLILNLSFDSQIRSQIIKSGLLPKLVNLLYTENHRIQATSILYNLSIENKSKAMFTFTNCIDYVMKMIIEAPNEEIGLELIALGINLALDSKCAVQMIEYSKKKGLKLLIKRAFKFKDSLIMKMVRNISQHNEVKKHFCEYVGLLGETITKEDKVDFLIEVVGTLGNLNITDIDYEMVLNEFQLVGWIKNMLTPGNADDDLVLDVIVLVGAVCIDDACANILSKSGIIELLIEMLNAKQEDDEIVLQIVYVFYQMIFHKSTREIIIKKTQAPAYLIDLMNDKNQEVRKVCSLTLDIISDYDEELAKKIQSEKFRFHNSQWLEMVENARISEMRNFNFGNGLGNKYASGMAGAMAASRGGYGGRPGFGADLNDYFNSPDDEPLDNYLTVQDADAIGMNNKVSNPADFYITETIPYDGRLSPDGLGLGDDGDLEFIDGDDIDFRNGIQSRMGVNSGMIYNRQMSYEQPRSRGRPNYSNQDDMDDDFMDMSGPGRGKSAGREAYAQQSRPKTGNRNNTNYGIDSSRYLDDSNYDDI